MQARERETQPSEKHDGVLSHRSVSGCLGGALCFVSLIKAIGLRIFSLCRSLSDTHGHSDPETLPRAAGSSGPEETSPPGLGSAGGHSAILLLHKRLLQVPERQWLLDQRGVMITG